jgi:hypothetical protein
LVVAGALAAAVLPAAAGAAGAVPSSGHEDTISNLKTITFWAYPQKAASAHASPSSHSRVVGKLKFLTPDGQAMMYLELRSFTHGRKTWIQVPLPGRPNGRVGWVPAGALEGPHVTHEYLLLDRESRSITLFKQGKAIFSAPVGVGRPSLPTPAGEFYILEKLTAIGGAAYGPYAFGTSATQPFLTDWPGGGVVGIHGTDQPQLIPGYPSHGCIRLKNPDITRLHQLLAVGTPLDII